jgi:hypothetical protein
MDLIKDMQKIFRLKNIMKKAKEKLLSFSNKQGLS